MTCGLKKHADVVRAYLDGEEIEFRYPNGVEWISLRNIINPQFLPVNEYRVKPKPIELAVNIYRKPKGFKYTVWSSLKMAKTYCGDGGRTVLMREVTEE